GCGAVRSDARAPWKAWSFPIRRRLRRRFVSSRNKHHRGLWTEPVAINAIGTTNRMPGKTESEVREDDRYRPRRNGTWNSEFRDAGAPGGPVGPARRARGRVRGTGCGVGGGV